MIDLNGLLDPLALLWTAGSVFCLVVSFFGVQEGLADWRAVTGLTNGRKVIAFDYIRTQAGRFVIGLGFGYIGLRYGLLDGRMTQLNDFTAVLIVCNWLLGMVAFLSLRDRRALVRVR